MGSKSVFLLCLFLAISLLVISEVAARDLAETTTSKKTEGENGLNDAKYRGNGGYGGEGNGGYGGEGYRSHCRYGCCRHGYYGGCRVCCHYAGQAAVTVKPEAKPHN